MSEGLNDIDMGSWDEEFEKEQNKNNLVIVDTMNLSFRYKHRGDTDFAADIAKTIHSLGRSYGARKIVCLNDYKGSAYRKHIHPLYKSDRKLKYKDQSEEEKQASAAFFDAFKKAWTLIEKTFPSCKLEGVEADDVACYLVEEFEDGEDFDHIWLISTDQDWDELLSTRCSRFSYTTRKEYTIDNFYDHHGCDTTEEFTAMKAIRGDLGDSVYGVDGIGVKRAYNLVRQYGSALDIAAILPLEGNQLFIKNLNESEEKLILNTELVDLRSYYIEAISFPNPENLEFMENLCEEIRG